MVTPHCVETVKELADAEDNVYEAQSRFLDNQRSVSAASIETAILRLGKSLEHRVISDSEHKDYVERLSKVRERIVRAYGKEEYEDVVGDLRKLREDLLRRTFDAIIHCEKVAGTIREWPPKV